MRLNNKKIQEIMIEKKLTEEVVCTRTGLFQKSLQWILKNGYVSEDAAERIADAIGVDINEVYSPDISAVNDNVIEFVSHRDTASVTFSQAKYKARIRELAKKRPEECKIMIENMDGSLIAHVPTSWIKIAPPAARSEKQRVQSLSNIQKAPRLGCDNK